MIKQEDLRDGMEVWYGKIEFPKKSLKISSIPHVKIIPKECILEIITHQSGNKLYVVKQKDLSYWRMEISEFRYGVDLGSTLYDDLEDLKKDWNRVINNEVDRISMLTLKAVEELVKQKYQLVDGTL